MSLDRHYSWPKISSYRLLGEFKGLKIWKWLYLLIGLESMLNEINIEIAIFFKNFNYIKSDL